MTPRARIAIGRREGNVFNRRVIGRGSTGIARYNFSARTDIVCRTGGPAYSDKTAARREDCFQASRRASLWVARTRRRKKYFVFAISADWLGLHKASVLTAPDSPSVRPDS